MRVYAPGSCRSTTGHKSTGLDESSDSDGESAIPDFDFESGHDSISFQPPQHEGEGYCSTEAVQGGYNSFIACLYRLQGAFEAVGEVIETGGAESSIEDVVGSG